MPEHWGLEFAQPLHTRAEGATDPRNNKVADGTTVVVTGAGKGLGYAIATSYALAGAKGIVISSRTQSDLDKLQQEIETISPKTVVLSQICDTQKASDVRALAEATKEKFGRADIVVANAGIISKYIKDEDGKERMPESLVEDDDFDRVIETNLMGSYRVAKYFVPLLIDAKSGPQAYICITSTAAHLNDSQLCPAAYNLSKIGNDRMVEHLHHDHHAKDGLQAFAVHPGAVLTPQTERHHETQRGSLWTDSKWCMPIARGIWADRNAVLKDDVGLCGGFLTWLTKERRDWLSGRHLVANWDVGALLKRKQEIVDGDKLVFKMVV